jgi:tetratricopeptide (TPR) repeat protein
MEAVFDSRQEALESSNLVVLTVWAGDYRRALLAIEVEAAEAESQSRVARAARAWATAASCLAALGDLANARAHLERAQGLAARASAAAANILYEGWEQLFATVEPVITSGRRAVAWAVGIFRSVALQSAARRGDTETALRLLDDLVPWLERSPAWAMAFPMMAYDAAEALWLLDRRNHAAIVERALRDKVIAPDFQHLMMDSRLALARLCALTGRHDEAVSWFAEARRVLSEQGARPLLAIADYDEALMYVRRGQAGDLNRARPVLDAARRQFEDLGMTGWIRRAEELSLRLT